MNELSAHNFGLLISYLLPGFAYLTGLAQHSFVTDNWMWSPVGSAPTVGGFLYATLASVGVGLLLSTLRWLLLDGLHHRTGVRRPRLDFGGLENCVTAYSLITDHHYSYYKFYGNSLVAVITLSVTEFARRSISPTRLIFLLMLMPVLFLGSRDTLKKYYARAHQLLEAQANPISVKKSDNETS